MVDRTICVLCEQRVDYSEMVYMRVYTSTATRAWYGNAWVHKYHIKEATKEAFTPDSYGRFPYYVRGMDGDDVRYEAQNLGYAPKAGESK